METAIVILTFLSLVGAVGWIFYSFELSDHRETKLELRVSRNCERELEQRVEIYKNDVAAAREVILKNELAQLEKLIKKHGEHLTMNATILMTKQSTKA